jgi:hypothetical protein
MRASFRQRRGGHAALVIPLLYAKAMHQRQRVAA